MTEAEWLGCTDPQKMLESLGTSGTASGREMRLLCAACCRRIWHLLQANSLRQGVDALERYADGKMGIASFRAAGFETHPLRAYREEFFLDKAWDGRFPAAYGIHYAMLPGPEERPDYGANRDVVACPNIQEVQRVLADFAHATRLAGDGLFGGGPDARPHEAECSAQADLLRDIFNPFGAAPDIEPAWLRWNDGTIRKLAQAAYEERALPSGTLDPHRLAVLADALEEAGCSDTELLEHLRGPGPHVRGCFAVDLVLGKD